MQLDKTKYYVIGRGCRWGTRRSIFIDWVRYILPDYYGLLFYKGDDSQQVFDHNRLMLSITGIQLPGTNREIAGYRTMRDCWVCLLLWSLCCVQDFVRLLDTNQWNESIELRSKVVSLLVELARRHPVSSTRWDGHIDCNVWVNSCCRLVCLMSYTQQE